MVKSMAAFLEKPTILYAMFFHLGITTLSNIATKLSFSEWAAGRPQEV
jgi:preprotein translocase subunit SecG